MFTLCIKHKPTWGSLFVSDGWIEYLILYRWAFCSFPVCCSYIIMVVFGSFEPMFGCWWLHDINGHPIKPGIRICEAIIRRTWFRSTLKLPVIISHIDSFNIFCCFKTCHFSAVTTTVYTLSVLLKWIAAVFKTKVSFTPILFYGGSN